MNNPRLRTSDDTFDKSDLFFLVVLGVVAVVLIITIGICVYHSDTVSAEHLLPAKTEAKP